MKFFLVCVSGTRKGRTWWVGGGNLLIGRGAECQVCIADASVSRKHCRVYQDQGELRFEDLGSRNSALVNGSPVKTILLRAGDEIAVGREIFMVGADGADAIDISTRADAFASVTNDDPVLSEQEESDSSKPRPRTIEDFVMLHETAREFGQFQNVSEFVESAAQRLQTYFRPDALWLARAYDQQDVSFYPTPGVEDPSATAPVDIIRRAVLAKKGLVVTSGSKPGQGKGHVSTLVIPVSLQDGSMIVAAVQTGAPDHAYTHADLQFMTMMVDWLAPFLHSVEYLEQLRRDNERLRARVGESLVLVGDSRAMGRVRGQIREAARSSLNVLITGETGTGKELAARLIHMQSRRASGPLVTVNCAAIPRELFEGELFGHEKGAYTGAHDSRPGLISCAHGGTLFLDEVGDLSLDNQARILRVVEYGVYRPVGASSEMRVDIRVVAATNRDIGAAIKAGQFRMDLYHRLDGFEIQIPPLRERVSDIETLASHFFEIGKGEAKRSLTGISPAALEHLRSRRWPGNVRELRNCILRAIATARREMIEVQDVQDWSVAGDSAVTEHSLSLVEAEKKHIRGTLEKCNGNIREAAKALQVSPSTLYRKMNQYNIK